MLLEDCSSCRVWICPVLSDLPRVQGLEAVCGPSFTQISLPSPLLPLCPLSLPPVVTFACSLSPFTSLSYDLPSLPLYFFSLPSFLCPIFPTHPPIFTSSPRGHVAHLGDDEDEDDDGADDDETHTQ